MEFENNFDNFIKWIESNGGYINDKLKISGNKGNRFFITTQPIEENERLIYIPNNLFISGNIMDKIINEFQLKEKSKYYNYINVLPLLDDFNYHPIKHFYDYDKNTYLKLSKNIYDILSDHDMKIKRYINNMKIDEQIIKRFYLISLTRSWEQGLIPLIDFFQHDNKPNTKFIIDNHIVLLSNSKIKSNEIISISYGLKSDLDFYITYGFVPNSNIYNIDLCNYFDIKNKLKVNQNTKFLLMENGFQINLIKELRFINLNKSEISTYDTNQVISFENEKLCLIDLFKILEIEKEKITNDEYLFCKFILHIPNKYNNCIVNAAQVIINNYNILTKNYQMLVTKLNLNSLN